MVQLLLVSGRVDAAEPVACTRSGLSEAVIRDTVEGTHTQWDGERDVLTLTENACDVVKAITQQSTEATEAGLRISQQGDEAGNFALATVDAPESGDQVVDENGARLFLDEDAAEALDQQVLDAQVDQEGGVQFALGTQA